MIRDFEKIRLFSTQIAKDYAPDLLRLLHLYKDISASEAASRLGMHIRTVQEFFDGLHLAGILNKQEVYESKRPYYRYTLSAEKIKLELNIASFAKNDLHSDKPVLIRERKNANARFTTSRNNLFISSVTIWIGEGRQRNEKRVNLTNAQGRFLFNLPFPEAPSQSVDEMMNKADIPDEHRSEIMDIVNLLIEHNVIETM